MRYYEKGVYPKVKRHFFPVICDHCEEAPCIEASENNGVGSFYKNKDGIVLIDYKKLEGRSAAQIRVETQAAVEACPLEAVFMNPMTNLPEKCTFCVHRVEQGLTPSCAQSCLGRVRVFGDLSDPESAASKLLAANASQTLMSEDDGGGAGVHYIGLEVTGLRNYGALEGGKAVDPNDFESGKISQTTGPSFKGWTPKIPVHKGHK